MTKRSISSSKQHCNVTFHEVQIPIAIRCAPVNEKYYLNIGLDFVYGFNVKSKTNISFGNGSLGNFQYSEDGQFNYAFLVGIGVKLKLNKMLNLNIEPTMKIYTKDYFFPKYRDDFGYQLIDCGIKTTIYLKK